MLLGIMFWNQSLMPLFLTAIATICSILLFWSFLSLLGRCESLISVVDLKCLEKCWTDTLHCTGESESIAEIHSWLFLGPAGEIWVSGVHSLNESKIWTGKPFSLSITCGWNTGLILCACLQCLDNGGTKDAVSVVDLRRRNDERALEREEERYFNEDRYIIFFVDNSKRFQLLI